MIIEISENELLGGKAQALARLADTGLRIPSWFAVAAGEELDVEAILSRAKEMNCTAYAVRSSARGEDGVEHSFAGQYDTYLNVSLDELIESIEKVHGSHDSEHLQTYKTSKEIAEAEAPTALVQEMLDPGVSGVAFSANPVSGKRNQAMVSALWGIGSAVVSGEADADVWLVDEKITERTIAKKTHYHAPAPGENEGVKLVEVAAEQQSVPCLQDEQVLAVAAMARRCEEHFGCPQDIEWAIEDGELYLLQSRPITTLGHLPDPDAPLTVWDNSNIAESYSGITSPLTFSFAERAYEYVYREFCKLLSVPTSRIKRHDSVFAKMLGHIRGHVYYNLNSWYEVLAMLPGFSVNRSFMEQMMGVKEPMPDEVVEEILDRTRTSKWKDTQALLKTLGGLLKNHFGLPRQIEKFYQRLKSALAEVDLTRMSGEELVSHYRDLEAQLLKRWDAPLINDFFAMIYYGVLKSLCEKWLGDDSLQNSLLLDSGEIISAEPPRRIKQMAELASEHEALAQCLADAQCPVHEKLAALRAHESLSKAYDLYLDDFGDRCLEELKLESPTVGDNPQALLTGIGVMAMRGGKTQLPAEYSPNVDVTMQLGWLKQKIFRWVMKQARNRVRDRENLRFERTRLFGRVRRIVVEIGKRLHHEAMLKSADDVFFLTIYEVMGAYEGGVARQDLAELVSQRKREKEGFTEPPPDRFETRGPVSHYTRFTPTGQQHSPGGDGISGTGACPGVVRGKVRVVKDPREATLAEGEILVAQQTDPGWVVLFPAASGLLVERGSLLSHSAIVARELQLPCIVSIRDVTSLLKTGDVVEMNGATGEIHIINHE